MVQLRHFLAIYSTVYCCRLKPLKTIETKSQRANPCKVVAGSSEAEAKSAQRWQTKRSAESGATGLQTSSGFQRSSEGVENFRISITEQLTPSLTSPGAMLKRWTQWCKTLSPVDSRAVETRSVEQIVILCLAKPMDQSGFGSCQEQLVCLHCAKCPVG